ncbi:MAG: 2-hydroxyacyl-CoA dehydratase, partial [Selenomonadaceae bacterium]|nr:2-hydroxyacyl-CoA dehydratase [Selenomonadaceae bacterium]
LRDFHVETKSYRCKGCGNKCLITRQTFPDGGKYFTGNRCERGIGGKPVSQSDVPNAFAYKYHRVFDYQPLALDAAPRGSIGLPRTLNMYEDYPFWFTFFTTLGFRVELSGKSSAQLYYKGMSTVPSDSLCYPAKLAHGHVMDLIERGVRTIFYPCEPYNFDTRSDNHYNCPVVASYAENIRGNMDILRELDVKFIQPFLPVDDMKKLSKRLSEEFPSIDRLEIQRAVDAAHAELEHYRRDVEQYGEQILERIKRTGEHAILLIGRPYHIDPEINHGIPELIQSYRLPIITEDAVYHMPVQSPRLSVVNQWSYHSRLYHAAQVAAENPQLILIQLSSFGCGLDALTTDQVKEILESHERIYTMIKLDEVSNLGAARIRLRSLLAALNHREEIAYHEVKPIERPRFTADCQATHTILAPQMAPIHFELMQTVLNKYNYKVVIPSMPDKAAIDLGLRYVNNDMCYPAIVVIGQLIAELKSGRCDPEHTSIILFQTCGACRATNYISVLRRALKHAGFDKVPVFACWGLPDETDSFNLSRDCLIDAIKGAVLGDLLMNVRNRMEPYELRRGQSARLYDEFMIRAKTELLDGNYLTYRRLINEIV